MRAVVLADQGVIDLLNQAFVNVWVLNYELKQLQEELGLANVAPLPRTIIKAWQPRSPVDCLVISPDLELLGCQPIHDLYKARGVTRRSDLPQAYREFLTASLKGQRPRPGNTAK